MRVAAPSESAQAFREALNPTVNFWIADGKRVVIFYNPPQGINPKGCLIPGESVRCSQTIAEAAQHDGNYRAVLSNTLGTEASVTYFDPFPYFCESGRCTVTHTGSHDNQLLYDDFVQSPRHPELAWTHLSKAGGEFLAEQAVAELLEKIAMPAATLQD